MIFWSSTSQLAAGGTAGGEASGTCTLLGPEGLGTMKMVAGTSGPFLLVTVVAGGGGTARTLRTTQWTRASLNRSSDRFS